MLPAIGQGALGIEIRSNDNATRKIIQVLNDQDTNQCVTAERMVNKSLNGGCHAPIAAHAVKHDETITISGLVGSMDGTCIIRAEISGHADKAAELGSKLGHKLLDKGAKSILDTYRLLDQ